MWDKKSLKQALGKGALVNGWVMSESAAAAAAWCEGGFTMMTVDLQHGLMNETEAGHILTRLDRYDIPVICRVRENDLAQINRMLDTGFVNIMCPMIDSVEDARRFVAACKYPPAGRRSFGPVGARLLHGESYAAEADKIVTTIGMIETRGGLDSLDAIAAVEGLDALYIGPNDLALALGCKPTSDPADERVLEAIGKIRDAAHRAGKKVGIHGNNAALVRKNLAGGFDFATLDSELGALMAFSRQCITACRSA